MSLMMVEGICAGYGGKQIIEDISFALDAGCLMGVLGANGCGKTTLLKALCGILPHRGRCLLDGVPLEKLSARQIARMVSYIPQRSGIAIDISALDVVLMGFNPQLGLLAHPTQDMRREALQALAQVGLDGQAETNYLHLSEGQKQLCILARTLIAGSRLLLLDEPESALDFRFRHRMLSQLRAWTDGGQRCAVVTLHDPALALNCCDRLLLMSGGKAIGTISPRTDAPDTMEQLLARIYGPVSLQRCTNRRGGSQLVMLREEEE